jgi:decaprenylphospho-beta-D-erythro-pentofuranosid-2-ulose 2-reductase
MRDALGRMQTVILLGGDSDIGVAIVRRMVADGARDIVLAGRNIERLEARAQGAQALRSAGAMRVSVRAFDAVATGTHAGFFDEAWKLLGDVDAVIVAFGALSAWNAWERAAESIEAAQTNYVGGVSAMVEASTRMRDQGHGSLVVVSSVAAHRPRRFNFVYGSTKAGLDAFAEGLSFVMRDLGVQVLTVRPGFVKTKMTAAHTPLRFATTPEAVAERVVRAIARGDELIWCPGILRWVMFAMDHVPRFAWRRIKF